jgi:hypothetical protein
MPELASYANLGPLLLVVGFLFDLRFFLLPVIADDTFQGAD